MTKGHPIMEADFVIVGAGSAGSAMAARLSEDGRHSVIVIEHGGTDFGPSSRCRRRCPTR
jgi:choline dehydrogenase-like flavoprotein